MDGTAVIGESWNFPEYWFWEIRHRDS